MTDPITADIGYQIHHILPTKVFEDYEDQISDWTDGAYNNAGYNLIDLPETDDYAQGTGYVRHRGSHPAYDNALRSALDDIFDPEKTRGVSLL